MTTLPRVDPPRPTSTSACATCGKPRHPERSYRYAECAAQRDPFCSRSCLEKWYGLDPHDRGTAARKGRPPRLQGDRP